MALSAAVQEAFNKGGTGGRQPALPDNQRVRVVIQPSKKAIGYIEREPFSSKSESPNSGIKALHMRFVVPEGLPHANRNFFASVPEEFEMFDRQGGKVPSYQSIGLVKALGYSLDDVDEDTLKNLTDREMLNKAVELVLGVEDDVKFNGADPEEAAKAVQNPLYAKRNTVKFINQASASTPSVPAGGFAGRAASGPPASAAPAATAATDPWAAAAAPAADPWAAAAPGTTI